MSNDHNTTCINVQSPSKVNSKRQDASTRMYMRAAMEEAEEAEVHP